MPTTIDLDSTAEDPTQFEFLRFRIDVEVEDGGVGRGGELHGFEFQGPPTRELDTMIDQLRKRRTAVNRGSSQDIDFVSFFCSSIDSTTVGRRESMDNQS